MPKCHQSSICPASSQQLPLGSLTSKNCDWLGYLRPSGEELPPAVPALEYRAAGATGIQTRRCAETILKVNLGRGLESNLELLDETCSIRSARFVKSKDFFVSSSEL